MYELLSEVEKFKKLTKFIAENPHRVCSCTTTIFKPLVTGTSLMILKNTTDFDNYRHFSSKPSAKIHNNTPRLEVVNAMVNQESLQTLSRIFCSINGGIRMVKGWFKCAKHLIKK